MENIERDLEKEDKGAKREDKAWDREERWLVCVYL